MKLPTYLRNNIQDYAEKRLTTMTISSSTGNDQLEIWYYGDLFKVPNEEQQYIVNTDFAPGKIIAKDPMTNEEILIFDAAKHGYDNMFCETYTEEQINNRPLQKLAIPASLIVLELGYSIDYEDEKDNYEIDENSFVTLIDDSKMLWNDVLCNGFDYLAISYINAEGKQIQFVDCELA